MVVVILPRDKTRNMSTRYDDNVEDKQNQSSGFASEQKSFWNELN